MYGPALSRTGRPQERVLAPIALAAGLAVAYLDSRPGWDATGITVVALVAVAFVAAAVSGRRPWLWAVLVGIWTPVIELPSGQPAALAALVFAAVGSGAGYLVARLARES